MPALGVGRRRTDNRSHRLQHPVIRSACVYLDAEQRASGKIVDDRRRNLEHRLRVVASRRHRRRRSTAPTRPWPRRVAGPRTTRWRPAASGAEVRRRDATSAPTTLVSRPMSRSARRGRRCPAWRPERRPTRSPMEVRRADCTIAVIVPSSAPVTAPGRDASARLRKNCCAGESGSEQSSGCKRPGVLGRHPDQFSAGRHDPQARRVVADDGVEHLAYGIQDVLAIIQQHNEIHESGAA